MSRQVTWAGWKFTKSLRSSPQLEVAQVDMWVDYVWPLMDDYIKVRIISIRS